MIGLMTDYTSRFTCKGKMIHQYMALSCFSEYTVVNEICLSKINEKAPLSKVCLLGCGIPTGMGAAINTAKVEVWLKKKNNFKILIKLFRKVQHVVFGV